MSAAVLLSNNKTSVFSLLPKVMERLKLHISLRQPLSKLPKVGVDSALVTRLLIDPFRGSHRRQLLSSAALVPVAGG